MPGAPDPRGPAAYALRAAAAAPAWLAEARAPRRPHAFEVTLYYIII